MTSVDGMKMRLRRRTVLAAAIGVIGLAGAAAVWADPDPVNLSVVDRETGQALRTWRHRGRLFVAGEPGARYGLRLTNHTNGRVLLVLSVDGVNILTGETAAYDQRGYVLDPYDAYDVNGWRKSTTEVAAFAFAPLPQSYAARTGRPSDVGVIGMAVFKERAPAQAEVRAPEIVAPAMRPDWREEPSSAASDAADAGVARRAIGAFGGGYSAPPAPSPAPPPLFIKPVEPPARALAGAAAPSQWASGVPAQRTDEKLGTAHGAREWSVMNIVTFERATPSPQWVRRIEYDTYDNLVASGVIPPSPYAERQPRPFPSSPDGAGFVPDPPIDP